MHGISYIVRERENKPFFANNPKLVFECVVRKGRCGEHYILFAHPKKADYFLVKRQGLIQLVIHLYCRPALTGAQGWGHAPSKCCWPGYECQCHRPSLNTKIFKSSSGAGVRREGGGVRVHNGSQRVGRFKKAARILAVLYLVGKTETK
eukprot:1194873-Prorocentrum_minimum.AAC.4